MVDPALHTAGIGALETAINRALSLDKITADQLGALEGKVFRLQCTQPTVDFYLLPQSGRVQLKGFHDGDVTTAIRGTAGDFADLATADDPAAALINGNIELDGDSAPLMDLQRVLAQLDLDWEAPLVSAFGDVAGHQLAEGLRGLFSWGRLAGDSVLRQLEEFIHEEARLAPPRAEVEDFYDDVDKLGQRVDRLAARISRLTSKLDKAS